MFEIVNTITKNLLSNIYIAHIVTIVFYSILFLFLFFIFKLVYRSYKIAKKSKHKRKTSWIKILKDIGYTMYTWSDKENEFVLSLPRLMYFISMILIIFVVITNKTDMLPPLLGFNISAMISYIGSKSLDAHNKRGDYSEGTIDEEGHISNNLNEIVENIKDKFSSSG